MHNSTTKIVSCSDAIRRNSCVESYCSITVQYIRRSLSRVEDAVTVLSTPSATTIYGLMRMGTTQDTRRDGDPPSFGALFPAGAHTGGVCRKSPSSPGETDALQRRDVLARNKNSQ